MRYSIINRTRFVAALACTFLGFAAFAHAKAVPIQQSAPLSVAPAPERLRTHPLFWLPGQSATLHALAALLSITRRATETAGRSRNLRLDRALALSQMCWTNGGRRMAEAVH